MSLIVFYFVQTLFLVISSMLLGTLMFIGLMSGLFRSSFRSFLDLFQLVFLNWLVLFQIFCWFCKEYNSFFLVFFAPFILLYLSLYLSCSIHPLTHILLQILKINPQKKNIDSIVAVDFQLIGYDPHQKIEMKMAV